ncbi:MAG: type II secretion system F family protein [Ilumatobacteraceae bacterium]
MSPLAWTVLLSAVGVGGVLVAVSGWIQPAPSLGRMIDHLQRAGSSTSGSTVAPPPSNRLVSPIVRAVTSYPRILPSASDLRVAGRTLDQHVVWMAIAAVVGLVTPPLAVATLQSLGVIGLDWYVPAIAGIGFAVLGPFIVHTTLIESAQTTRADFRYQTSAYLDVVTMLLAGNTGYEGALEQAAHAGDGRLFLELRRRMRESGARGSSLTDALQRAGQELGLDELEQIAATAALSAAEGAPVARTLAAKCATLRGALSTEQESEARLRTSRLTTPIVGMALIFMALVMYPALNFS